MHERIIYLTSDVVTAIRNAQIFQNINFVKIRENAEFRDVVTMNSHKS